MPLSFDRPETYRYNGRDKDGYLAVNKIDPDAAAADDAKRSGRETVDAKDRQAEIITAASQLDFLHRTAMDAQISSDDILRMTSQSHVAGGVSRQSNSATACRPSPR